MSVHDDITQPISESYFNLSQDISDLTSLSDHFRSLKDINPRSLDSLIQKIDFSTKEESKQNDSNTLNDDTELIIETHETTPKVISIDELAHLLQPIINEELKDFKTSIKKLLLNKGPLSEPRQPAPRAASYSPSEISHNQVIQSSSPIPDVDSDNDLSMNLHKLNFDSPGTTPPVSQDQKASTMSELERLQMENKMLKKENLQMYKLKQANHQLKFKLDDSHRYNKEILNELNYYKQRSAHPQPQDTKPLTSKSESSLISKETLEARFQSLYDSLNLADIDQLSRTQMANLIKNLLLTLVLNFRELPGQLSRLIKVHKIALRFIDQVHGQLYVNSPSPLMYFDTNKPQEIVADSDVNLAVCLDNMASIIGNASIPRN
ncbi:hypothetical protein PSN45_003981 [Yamadazyma tenuis]|uniref:Uncharacterized protein n=1 Tax=Candida tenuis (strain ATCC 10573 / BCRC 21748 / CBS 615 / JCM 9827 / NBRC 10315 / NRRL Y-1498 / VKM Y-70) TaxID=590646 RepID=G3B4B7_CANTC|nr:uncharacterized protein CANTEDRAFT_113969 [Yamadazyma tenuis ATCC 10573]EGV63943.1 hypothetical protein CANTEDRAFT_113969 [Yamadazyma tenuis ATCC 10573]WEJ96442.1 hypothetical protein PSN45_003981 [Yamadazyma tenuis]